MDQRMDVVSITDDEDWLLFQHILKEYKKEMGSEREMEIFCYNDGDYDKHCDMYNRF